MGGRENIKQAKNEGSIEVSSWMEGIYGRAWQFGKEGGFKKYKKSSSRVWRRDKYKSEKTEKVRHGRRKKL